MNYDCLRSQDFFMESVEATGLLTLSKLRVEPETGVMRK